MHVDCTTCPVRGLRCDGCMVTALLSLPVPGGELDAVERRAVDALRRAGLVSPAEAATACARTEAAAGLERLSVG